MNYKKWKRLTSVLLSLSMALSSNMVGAAAELDTQALPDGTNAVTNEADLEAVGEGLADPVEHEHDFTVLVREIRKVDCEKAGVALYKCSGCDEQEYITTRALGHDFSGQGVEIEASSCSEPGSARYTCQRENCPRKDSSEPATEVRPLPLLSHTWSDEEITQQPTCLEPGGYYIECTVCHAQKEDSWREDETTKALGHSYEDENDPSYTPTIVDATCKDAGSKTWHCTREGCDAEDKVETIPATGNHDYKSQDVPATCTEPKKVGAEVCSVCGDVRGQYHEEGEALGHDLITTPTTPATCTTGGENTITCSRCDYTDTEEVEALGHTQETIPAVAPTCGTDGKTSGVKCSVCQEILTPQQTVPAESDKHVYDVAGTATSTMREATCTVNGLGKFTCTVCQKATSYQVIPAHHGFEDAKHNLLEEGEGNFTLAHTKEATCTADGVDTYTCGACGETQTESVDASGHDFEEEGFDITAVGTADNSYACKATTYTYTCKQCKVAKTTKTVEASAEHVKVDGSLSATCTEPEKEGWECSVCGESEYKNVEGSTPNGHDYDKDRDGQVDEGFADGNPGQVDASHPATCEAEGYIIYTCGSCQAGENEAADIASGHIKKVTLEKLSHTPVASAASEDQIPADCQHNAQEIVRCENCDTVIETKDVYQEAVEDLVNGGMLEEEAKEACKDLAKTDHKWEIDSNGIFREATCTANGIGKYKCATCDETKNQVIPAHHAYEDEDGKILKPGANSQFTVTTKTPASCREAGVDIYTCSICTEGTANKSKEVPTEATGHDYENDKNFDITAEGKSDNPNNYPCKDTTYTYECKDCEEGVEGHTTTKTVPAEGTHTEVTDNKEATCTEPAKTGWECSVCGESEHTNVEGSAPTGHDYDKDCDGEIDEDWEDNGATYRVDTDASCTAEGKGTYTCNSCDAETEGHTKTVSISKLSHTPVSSIKPADCQGNAKAIETCSVCEQEISSVDLVEMLGEEAAKAEGYVQTGHVLRLTSTFRQATCTTNGIGKYECTTCDHTENKVIPGHHAYEDEEGNLLESGSDFSIKHTTKPTCTEKGVDTYTCNKCAVGTAGKEHTEEVDATGHDFDQPDYDWDANGTVTTQATCKAGEKTYTCAVCQEKTTRSIDPTQEHDYDDDGIIEATCTEPMKIGRICKVCGDVDGKLTEVGEPEGHDYDKDLDGVVDEGFAESHPDQVEVLEDPTCEEDGRGIYTCKSCEEEEEGHTLEAAIPATGHDPVETYQAPTCDQGGKIIVKCSHDQEVLDTIDLSEIDPPHEPVMEEFGAVKATCKAGGKSAGTRCKLCQKVYTQPKDTAIDTSDSGHKWELTVDGCEEPTCTTAGKEAFECKLCGATKEETIPAAHKWGEEEFTSNEGALIRECEVCHEVEILAVMPGFAYCENCKDAVEPEIIEGVPAKCEIDGKTDGERCPECGNTITEQETIPALDHSPEWVVTEAATCGKDGSKIERCETCGKDIGQPVAIPATGQHEYEETLIDATCEEDDMIKYICKGCGEEDPSRPTQRFENTALGHNFVDGVCTNNCGTPPYEAKTAIKAYVEDGKNKVQISATMNVADKDYKVVRRGLIYVTAAGFSGELTVDAVGKGAVKELPVNDGDIGAAMTITVSAASADRILYGRAYVIIEKGNERQTIYDDTVSGSFNSLIGK